MDAELPTGAETPRPSGWASESAKQYATRERDRQIAHGMDRLIQRERQTIRTRAETEAGKDREQARKRISSKPTDERTSSRKDLIKAMVAEWRPLTGSELNLVRRLLLNPSPNLDSKEVIPFAGAERTDLDLHESADESPLAV